AARATDGHGPAPELAVPVVGLPPGNGHGATHHGTAHRPPASGFPRPAADVPPARRHAKGSREFRAWAAVWSGAGAYRLSLRIAGLGCRVLDRRDTGWLRRVPLLPGASGWTATRDLPVVARRSFHDEWRARRGEARGSGS